MKTPTLEEVKEYFKNAKEVKTTLLGEIHKIDHSKPFTETKFGFYCNVIRESGNKEIFDKQKNKFAEIISYKDTYTVSKEFILEAHKEACSTLKAKIENEFKELFPKVELEVGKWYKHKYSDCDYLINYQGNGLGHGFFNGTYSENWCFGKQRINEGAELATKEEIETALSNEAKSKYKGKKVKCLHFATKKLFNDIVDLKFQEDGCLRAYTNNDCLCLFDNGKWAEIISEPIELTIEQIAEKFGVEVEQIKIKK